MELYTAKQKEPQGKEGHSLDGAVSESVPLLICVSSYQWDINGSNLDSDSSFLPRTVGRLKAVAMIL